MPLDAVRSHPTESVHPVALPLDPARLPALAAPLARLQRLAVDERLSALLTHSFGVAGWTASTHAPIEAQQAAYITLRWGLQQAGLTLDLSQHAGLASLAAAEEATQPALRAAVCAILLEPLSAAFAQLGMDGVEILSLERATAPRPNGPCCALAFRLGSQRIDAVLEHIDTEWLEVLERLVVRQCLPFAAHVSGIAVPGRLLVGEKIISVATLDSLRPGDVVLRAVRSEIASLYRGELDAARMQIVWGRYGTRQLRAMARVGPQSFTLEEDPVMSHDTQFNAPLADSIDTPVDISHLDLPLKIEIDTVSLPVSQLSALRAGYVLELPTALPEARIRLVTYGQTIGFGELVSVGDHLGVRLLQLPQQPHHGSV